jgi:hypothetical protein
MAWSGITGCRGYGLALRDWAFGARKRAALLVEEPLLDELPAFRDLMDSTEFLGLRSLPACSIGSASRALCVQTRSC